MNPILADIYSTVIPSAPYLIAAYALIWVALLVYVAFVVKGIKKTERQMAALEAAIERDNRATD
ncbi:MAG: CcmD family protein [Eggerthellaceae bacterium]|nr:CcmD family protein [Eggerthellaceae bacterium]